MTLKHHSNDYVSQVAMDDLGNRDGAQTVRGVSGTKSYTVDTATNQYTVANSVTLTNAYDNAGNMTKDENGYRYYYDYENRITEIHRSDNTTVVAQFAYDALGRRIRVIDSIAATTTLYYYNTNWQVLFEKNASGTDAAMVCLWQLY